MGTISAWEKKTMQVLSVNEVDVCIAADFDYTPTPVISHAIV
jgi:phosphoglucomutase